MMKDRFELPLEKDASSRFLPGVIFLMSYLASICLAIFLCLSGGMERWQNDVTGQLAVQILPGGIEEKDHDTLSQVLALLNQTPGILSARLLSPEEMNHLLSPWLGEGMLIEEFPVPHMVAVEADPARLDTDTLRQQLHALGKEVILDDHGGWFADLLRLSRLVEILSLIIILCILIVSGATVIFVTRSGLAVHASVVEVLHLIGAQDSYIAHQFQSHALRLGIRGAFGGFLFALLTVILLVSVSGGMRMPVFLALDMSLWQGLILFAVPIILVLVMAVTARLTVQMVLSRIL